MDEKCFADGCPGTANFSCSCDEKLQICQEHIAEHIRGPHNHVICISNRAQQRSKLEANKAFSTLNNLNTRALAEGKGMFQELCDKLCTIVDELTRRQQCLVDLSSLNYSQKVEDQIQELVTVNIAFRDKSDFKKLLDKFMAPGGETFDSLSLEDFKKDFRGILECLNQSNRVLESVTGTHKEEQALRKQLESRIENLEKGKIQNIEQRLQRFEQEAQAHAKMIEDLRKSLEKNDDKVEAADKRLKDKWDQIQMLSKSQMNQFQALENGIRKSAEDNNLALNKKYKELNEKFGEIKQFKDADFKKMLEKFINDAHDRRIVFEEERRKKEEEEEERRKKEEEERLHPERSNCHLEMDITQKIEYFHPTFLKPVFNWELNYCKQYIKELIVSNDGKYLFFCKFN